MHDDHLNDEQLIGYLLRALEPSEMLEVERRLRDDTRLRARLEQLEAMLEPLEQDRDIIEPPSELRERTLQAIYEEMADDEGAGEESAGAEYVDTPSSHAKVASGMLANHVTNGGGDALTPAALDSHRGAHSWWDAAFSVASFVAVLALLFPAIYESREQSRTAACQDRLRELGHLLTNFALRADDQRIPALDKSGREAFAGVYAVRLKGMGLLDQDQMVWCPAALTDETIPQVPGPEALASADDQRLALWQKLAGGGYEYNLGVLENDRFHAPRLQGRSNFAWMSDLVNARSQSVHPGVVNVLFEDGHVARKAWFDVGAGNDHPHRNDAGRREAGLSETDAVLAPSAAPPFVWVEQR